ncbi:MAG: serine protease [Thermodesulfobacteriota bacterium]
MKPKFFEEQVFFITLKIESVNPTTGASSVGTGFIVKHPVSEKKSFALLVTCKHVLFGGVGYVTLSFNKRETEGALSVKLGDTVKIGPATYNDVYTEHEDTDIDIATVNISSIIDNNPLIFFKNLKESNWADFNDEKLLPMAEVIFVGYPIGFSDQLNNLPIARAGKIASHPRVDFNGKPEYLIDAQVFPGSSGSPVFTLLNGKYRLCGVVGQSISRTLPVENIQVATVQTVQDFIGLGVVYKPNAVMDVIRRAAERFTSSDT